MKLKRNVIFCFFLLAGVLLGTMLSSITAGVPFLSWLSFGTTIGISTSNPLLLDLSLVKLAFGCEIGVNVAQIFTITAALLIYKNIAAKL